MMPLQSQTFLVGTIKTRRLPLSRRVEARPSRSFEARVRPQLRTSAISPLPLDVRQEVGDELGFEVINLQLRRWGAIRLDNFRLLEIGSKTAAITAKETKLSRSGCLHFGSHPAFSQTQILSTDDVAKARVAAAESGGVAGISKSHNAGVIRGQTPYTHHRQRYAGFGQPEQYHGGSARPGADAGLRSIREACPPEPRAHSRTRPARQGLRRLRDADHHSRHHEAYQGQGVAEGQNDRGFPALFDGGGRARRRRRRARRPRLRAALLYRRRQLGHGRQQYADILRARRAEVP